MPEVTGQLCGSLLGGLLYRIEIRVEVYQRLVELTQSGVQVPDWLDYGQPAAYGHRSLVTSDPEWFSVYFRDELVPTRRVG